MVRAISLIALLILPIYSQAQRVFTRPYAVLAGHTAPVSSIAVSSDGRLLLSVSHGPEAIPRLWSVESTNEIRTFSQRHLSSIMDCVFMPEDSEFLTAGYDGAILRWNIAIGTVLSSYDHGKPVYSIAINDSGVRIISGSLTGGAKIWATASEALLRSVSDEHTGNSLTIPYVGFNAALGFVTSAYLPQGLAGVRIRDENGRLIDTIGRSNGGIVSMAISPDGDRIALADSDHNIRIYDVESGTSAQTIDYANGFNNLSFSSDGELLASGQVYGGDKQRIVVSNGHTGKHVIYCHVAFGEITDTAFALDDRFLIASLTSGDICMWVVDFRENRADVDESNAVDSVDLQIVINVVLGVPMHDPMLVHFSDVDDNGNTDAVDIQHVINEILAKAI